jgi:hypothetical protein
MKKTREEGFLMSALTITPIREMPKAKCDVNYTLTGFAQKVFVSDPLPAS